VLAAGLLVAVLGWRIGLATLAPLPLRANELLAPPPGTPADSGRLVLVVNVADADAGVTADRIRLAHPHRPVEVLRVRGQQDGTRGSSTEGVAALVRAYGHAELPVLLVVTPDGQVARVQAIAEKNR
jgi:hypothetical protein